MKAWQLNSDGPLELVERADPEPGEGQVTVAVRASGLCHSDVMQMAIRAQAPVLPVIPGHELAGQVVRVGPGVTGWAAGDRVSVCPSTSFPPPGFFRDGGFATHCTAFADELVRVPDVVGWTPAAMMTDAGMTSYHALVKRGGCRAGMKVGVIGLGGLGQIAARVAVVKGADVHVAEPKEDVWPVAGRLGVRHVVADASAWEGQDFDLVVDYAGYGTTTDAAVKAVRRRGTVVLVGLGKRDINISSGAMVSREVSLLASRGGTREDITELYDLVAAGELDPTVTEIAFDDIPRGIQELADHKVTGRLVALL